MNPLTNMLILKDILDEQEAHYRDWEWGTIGAGKIRKSSDRSDLGCKAVGWQRASVPIKESGVRFMMMHLFLAVFGDVGRREPQANSDMMIWKVTIL